VVIRKRIESDENEYEYYSYKITSEGIELLLEKENEAFSLQESSDKPSFDDDIPF
jgi:hypothetical protein